MMNTKNTPTCLKRVAMTCAALATAAAAHGQVVVYVDDDAPPFGNGRTWDSAFNDLQLALAQARDAQDDMEIRVGAGVYLPSQVGSPYASFRLGSTTTDSGLTLTLKGAFRGLGGGGDPNERDLSNFKTVLSGDLAGNDEPGFVNYEDNSDVVVTLGWRSIREWTWLDGFVIRGGGSEDSYRGGGMYVWPMRSNLFLMTNCVVMENKAWDGGGMVANGAVHVSNTLFLRNRAYLGGAVFSYEDSGQSFINCSFVDNEALRGSAFFVTEDSGAPVVANSILVDESESTIIDGHLDLRYSCLSEFYPGRGTIIADPRFVDRENGDYRLGAGSPCIDSADTRLMPRELFMDLGGDVRLFDDPVSPNVIGGFGVVVDMGAFEYQGCDIDFNGDGRANTVDLLALLNLLNDGCE